jgi:hypothetical protein
MMTMIVAGDDDKLLGHGNQPRDKSDVALLQNNALRVEKTGKTRDDRQAAWNSFDDDEMDFFTRSSLVFFCRGIRR